MRHVALYFASGESLYAGSVLLSLAVATSHFFKHHLMRRLWSLVMWSALAMMVMACPPFPWIVDAFFFAAFGLWFIAADQPQKPKLKRLRLTSTAIVLVFLVILPTIEFSHRMMPKITGVVDDHLVVIGDSISSGIGPGAPSWPSVLPQMIGVPVKNLARPAALTTDAFDMAAQLSQNDHVILIEIGGNDLLGNTHTDDFEQSLETLLRKVSSPARTIVMFELPLLPYRIAYGQIQRRLAARYGVWLIPKRYFTEIIVQADATSDGVHLTDAGAHRMAELVARTLSPVLTSGSHNLYSSIVELTPCARLAPTQVRPLHAAPR